MDLKKHKGTAVEFLKKYRYAVLVLVIGIILMVLPGKSQSTQENTVTQPTQTETSVDLSKELTKILSEIQGVGKVQVLLTIKAGSQTIYQVDENISTSENGSTINKETVIITGSNREEQPLVSYITQPTYLGAIIVCQGADQPAVKLAIIDAVSKITGLSSDKISVVKMK